MNQSDTERAVREHYAAIHRVVGDGGQRAVLHIGDAFTGIAVGQGAEVQATLILAIGSQRTAREFFRHTPPSPLELENAIATVEDEVTCARTLVERQPRLYTRDASILAIAALSGVTESDRMELSLEAMERSFDRLTSVSLGKPAAQMGLPADNGFAATLLVLREFMHHLGFVSITCMGTAARF
jgi:exopolyphosphatase/pppGpp-phosphohydrolase